MRRISPIIAILLAVPLAAAEPPPRAIAVHGRAREMVAADRFTISWSVRMVRPKLEAARQDGEATLAQLAKALADAGLPAPLVTARQLGRETRWDAQAQEHRFVGFSACTALDLTLERREQMQAALALLVQSDAVAVGGVAYGCRREIELRKEVRRRALLAARDKAADMAATLGVRVGRALNVSEGSTWWLAPAWNDNRLNIACNASRDAQVQSPEPAEDAASAPVGESMVAVVADVDATFALEDAPGP